MAAPGSATELDFEWERMRQAAHWWEAAAVIAPAAPSLAPAPTDWTLYPGGYRAWMNRPAACAPPAPVRLQPLQPQPLNHLPAQAPNSQHEYPYQHPVAAAAATAAENCYHGAYQSSPTTPQTPARAVFVIGGDGDDMDCDAPNRAHHNQHHLKRRGGASHDSDDRFPATGVARAAKRLHV
ncbi:hypothetical protein HDU83_006705 [Entophlyctis luteolus]|nr:hypothetical protein HDU83_006705 [Entophlyctis luteolus]